MSPRQNRYTPLTQPLDRYPQIQPLIDPIAYGDLGQKVENHEKKHHERDLVCSVHQGYMKA